jgi:hypothetical protein
MRDGGFPLLVENTGDGQKDMGRRAFLVAAGTLRRLGG